MYHGSRGWFSGFFKSTLTLHCCVHHINTMLTIEAQTNRTKGQGEACAEKN